MVIYELGLIKEGVLLVEKQYYQEYQMKVDPLLRSGFFSALNSFAEEAFSDSIESFSMKNFKIALLTHPISESNPLKMTCYCIGDRKMNIDLAQKALTKVLGTFLKSFSFLEDFSVDLAIFEEFKKVIDNILGDLVKKPDDRLRSIFG